MKAEKLTELGFSNIFRPTIDETAEAIHEAIDNDPDLAKKVLDEVQDEANPYPVNKDNYEIFLEDWVNTKAESLHLIQY